MFEGIHAWDRDCNSYCHGGSLYCEVEGRCEVFQVSSLMLRDVLISGGMSSYKLLNDHDLYQNKETVYNEDTEVYDQTSFCRRGVNGGYNRKYLSFCLWRGRCNKMNEISNPYFALYVHPSYISIAKTIGRLVRSNFHDLFSWNMNVVGVHINYKMISMKGNVEREFCFTCRNCVCFDVQSFRDGEIFILFTSSWWPFTCEMLKYLGMILSN